MKQVFVNKENYIYDIHSLMKSFYADEEVSVKAFDSGDIEMEDTADFVVELGLGSFEIRVKDQLGNFEVKKYITSSEHTLAKNHFKREFYLVLSRRTDKELPWGDLTGIRPTKIPMNLLAEGKTDDEIKNYMKNTYLVSDEKAELSLVIAKREESILQKINYSNGYSLYIGIPFCPTTCLYCSFTSFPICAWEKRVDEYLDAVQKELDYTAEAYRNYILDTVYIGGGTPMTLSAEQMDRLLTYVEKKFDLSHIKELTVEAGRPDSITQDKLRIMKQHNVSRISINPQTMKDETLRIIGRRHTVQQTIDAFCMARREGFDNINMDLIMGLPGEDIHDVEHTLQEIEKLSPDSLTVHSLAVKRASRLNQWMEENGRDSIRNTPQMMELTERFARKSELHPYYLYRQKNMAGNFENVGYAKDGKYGIYNILIMEEVQTIIACGAGTVTKRVFPDGRIERCDNVKDVTLYMDKINEMIDRKRKLLS